MRQKQSGRPSPSERVIKDIKRNTRKQYGAEEKIRIVLDGLRAAPRACTALLSCADGRALPRACISAKPALGVQMVQGLHGGRQEAPGRRHRSTSQYG